MKNNYIKIYSHPRSGTHFLEAFLAKNFYQNHDLSSEGSIYYGHWSNKILLEEGEPYHKLFGSHFFPDKTEISEKTIYIYRDGRAVIASLWNSGFYNTDWKGISFSDYLRKDIDWFGGTGQKMYPKMNIIQHWEKHIDSWLELNNRNIFYLSFEDLKNNPHKVYNQINKKFFPIKYYKEKVFGNTKIDPIKSKVGLKPNAAKINSWESLFSRDDLDFFYSQLTNKDYLFKNE
ncbi:sulfotransferase domain-containing protein [Meridianimaribacter flavus]|uniref:Sulfotransferase domain-containing protein n=1 Tax=Meridianimaribacter flavus TaxID=571115 RepID=A0ABY2G4N6_9FLAO|nr:sulfotransferase domain-containing protein [Meridianimaribacter flavus]TDY11768.1 sulfotransferase domain-containing protein [Meridianimaribacter flavus]